MTSYAQAARYQMIIMFMIASTTSLASVAAIILAAFEIVDERSQLHSEKLAKQDKSNSLSRTLRKAFGWVSLAVVNFWLTPDMCPSPWLLMFKIFGTLQEALMCHILLYLNLH